MDLVFSYGFRISLCTAIIDIYFKMQLPVKKYRNLLGAVGSNIIRALEISPIKKLMSNAVL